MNCLHYVGRVLPSVGSMQTDADLLTRKALPFAVRLAVRSPFC